MLIHTKYLLSRKNRNAVTDPMLRICGGVVSFFPQGLPYRVCSRKSLGFMPVFILNLDEK